MHTITLPREMNALTKKLYITAVTKGIGVELPCTIQLITPKSEEVAVYMVTSYSVPGIKRINKKRGRPQ
jgi:hypothetical protein